MSLFRNIKNGNVYRAIGTCINTTNAQNGQLMMQYKQLKNKEIYVRGYEEFLNEFKPIDIDFVEPYCGAVDNLLNGVN